LPAGCFNPYSGVKTSILILDKSLAKQSDTVAFFKVENDGFGLGAQRRVIEKNDLPQVQAELSAYLHALRAGAPTDAIIAVTSTAQIVPKEKIAANGDHNLSSERYREGAASNHSFPLVSLGEEGLFRIESGGTPKSDVEEYWGGDIPWATLVDLPATDFISEIAATKRTISEKGLQASSAKMIPANSVVVSSRATIGRIAINRIPISTNQGFKNVVIEDLARAVPEFVALALIKLVPTMKSWATGGTFAEISKTKFCELQMPLPPLEVQKEIVAVIEGYQKVINGARAVLDHYRPHIPIHPDWPKRNLGSLAENLDSRRVPITKSDRKKGPFPYYGASGIVDSVAEFIFDEDILLISEDGANLLARSTPIAFSVSGKCWVNNHAHVLRFAEPATQKFVEVYLNSISIEEFVTGAAQPKVNQEALNRIQIPIPDNVTTQQAIVAEIEAEQALVAANRELITRFEQKIQATLARIWGEDKAADSGQEKAA
ncbi:MAG: restriction endonuclease subunit S, partial [Dokdonella sp.]